MAKLTYSIPSEFSDEDRWFKYFTKRDLGVLVTTGAFTVLLFKLTDSLFGKPLIGLIIGVIIVLISMACSMVKLPDTLWLKGGCQPIATILLRRLIRRKKRVIYVKGYREEE